MRMYRTNVGMYACSPNSANIQIEGYILDVNVGTHNIFNQMRHGRQCFLHSLYTMYTTAASDLLFIIKCK